MSRVGGFLLDLIPLDVAERRAVDETVADWRHEAALARTLAARVFVPVRGAVALASVLTRLTVRSLLSPEVCRPVMTVVAVAVALGLLGSIVPFAMYAPQLNSLGASPVSLAGVWALLLPSMMSTTLVFAMMTPVLRGTDRPTSLLGVCLAMTLVAALNVGLLAPAANRAFRETTHAWLLRSGDNWVAPDRTQGWAEMSIADLVGASAAGGYRGNQAATQINTRSMLLFMVPVALLVGDQARRLARARRWRWGAVALAWSSIFFTWAPSVRGAHAVVMWLHEAGLPAAALVLGRYRVWVVPVVSLAIALVFAWIADRAERRRTTSARLEASLS